MTKPKSRLEFVVAQPYRCSRGHIMLVTRPEATAQPGNCDHLECQDKLSEPVQIGRRQTICFTVYLEAGNAAGRGPRAAGETHDAPATAKESASVRTDTRTRSSRKPERKSMCIE